LWCSGSGSQCAAFGGELLRDIAAQFRLLYLADVGKRQSVDQLDSFGPFELGDATSVKKLPHDGERDGRSLAQRQIGARPLTEDGIGHRYNGGGAHRRMRNQVRFDFFGADLFATAVDQVFDSSLDDQVSRRIEPDQVAGAIESLGGERLAIAIRRAEVAANRVWSAAPQFTNRARRDVCPVGVDDPNLVSG
jgi:hypothetical protein